MILLVDAGNTRIKWRMLGLDLEFKESGVVLAQDFEQAYFKEKFSGADISHVYIASVANRRVLTAFQDFASEKNAMLKNFASKQKMLDVKLKYDDVKSMGVDRSLALVGAYEGKGVLVVDAGSAITADYLCDEGEYLGGYIVPGLRLSGRSLIDKTEKISVMLDKGQLDLGLSTSECVSNGLVMMYRSLMSGFISVAESKGISRYVVTGGDAGLFREWYGESVELYENLVLDGLMKYCVVDSDVLRGNEK